MSLLLGMLMLVELLTPTSFDMTVARRCAGEGAHPPAMQMCACSVRHRLRAGWAPERVLGAYYAPDVQPSEEGLAAVAAGLRGACVGGEYFFMSRSNALDLGFKLDRAVASVRWGNGKEVMSFSREEWAERKRR